MPHAHAPKKAATTAIVRRSCSGERAETDRNPLHLEVREHMNMARSVSLVAFVSAVLAALWTCDASAQTVKVTPLGSHTGELCQNDRALLFEDPTGVRILYDVEIGRASCRERV